MPPGSVFIFLFPIFFAHTAVARPCTRLTASCIKVYGLLILEAKARLVSVKGLSVLVPAEVNQPSLTQPCR